MDEEFTRLNAMVRWKWPCPSWLRCRRADGRNSVGL